MTSLVKIDRKGQMILPIHLRHAVGIAAGDMVEAKVERGKIVLTARATSNTIPVGKTAQQAFFKQLHSDAPPWLRDVWAASMRRGTDKLTMRQIDGLVAEVRRGPPKKKTKRPAA
jgi:AbrB family looped-hinge helix DNA binding protein